MIFTMLLLSNRKGVTFSRKKDMLIKWVSLNNPAVFWLKN